MRIVYDSGDIMDVHVLDLFLYNIQEGSHKINYVPLCTRSTSASSTTTSST